MSQNLFQVANRDDLLFHLRGGEGKIIVLTLVLLETDDAIKTMLRKYIKRKSEQYPSVFFLYYNVRKEDFGKVGKLLPDDKKTYPRLYHIFNVVKLMGQVWNINKTNKSIGELDESFNILHNYYSEFDPNLNDDQEEYSDQKEESEEPDPIPVQQTQKPKKVNKQQVLVNKKPTYNLPKSINHPINQPINMQQNPNLPVQLDKTTEKKKLLEKIMLIQQKSREYQTEIINEITSRKKEEKKLLIKLAKKNKGKEKVKESEQEDDQE